MITRGPFYGLEIGAHVELITDPALTESWCLRIGRLYVFWRGRLRLFWDRAHRE